MVKNREFTLKRVFRFWLNAFILKHLQTPLHVHKYIRVREKCTCIDPHDENVFYTFSARSLIFFPFAYDTFRHSDVYRLY